MTRSTRNIVLSVLLGAGVPNAQAESSTSTVTLSMEGAIRQAIQTNLINQLALAGTQEARGQAFQAAASLLPRVTGSVFQSRTYRTNLAAQGFHSNSSFPNLILGP